LTGDLRGGGLNPGRGRTLTLLATFDPGLAQKMIFNQNLKVSEIINFAKHSRKKV